VALGTTGSWNRPSRGNGRQEIMTVEAPYFGHAAVVHAHLFVASLAGTGNELRRMAAKLVTFHATEVRPVDDMDRMASRQSDHGPAFAFEMAGLASRAVGLPVRVKLLGLAEPRAHVQLEGHEGIGAMALLTGHVSVRVFRRGTSRIDMTRGAKSRVVRDVMPHLHASNRRRCQSHREGKPRPQANHFGPNPKMLRAKP